MVNRRTLAGRRFSLDALRVDAGEAALYAAAVGDEPKPGTAPAFYSVRLVAPLWRLIYQAPELGTADQLVLHAEQKMLFHRDMRIGEVLDGHAEVRDVVGFGFGDAAIIRCTLADTDGRSVVTMESTLAVQGSSGFPPDPRRFTQPSKKDLAVEMSQYFGEETPQQYADAADDHNPLHLDDELARQAGHPRRIVHGMCTLATGISGLANKLDGRLSYVRARFTRPVLPDTAVDFTAHRSGSPNTYLVSAKHAGKAVLKSTWFRLGDQ